MGICKDGYCTVFPVICNGCQEETLGVEAQQFSECPECDEMIESKCSNCSTGEILICTSCYYSLVHFGCAGGFWDDWTFPSCEGRQVRLLRPRECFIEKATSVVVIKGYFPQCRLKKRDALKTISMVHLNDLNGEKQFPLAQSPSDKQSAINRELNRTLILG
jgi:hypothetical protein